MVDDEQGYEALTVTLDISATGLRLHSRHPLPLGRQVPLRLRLPNDERIEIQVIVIWVKEAYAFHVKEYQIGVRIVDHLTENEAKFIKCYAKELKSLM
jgi:hypothetical protein